MPKAQKRRTAAQNLRHYPIPIPIPNKKPDPEQNKSFAFLLAHGCSKPEMLHAAIFRKYGELTDNEHFKGYLARLKIYPASDKNICLPNVANIQGNYSMDLSTIGVNLLSLILRRNTQKCEDLVEISKAYVKSQFEIYKSMNSIQEFGSETPLFPEYSLIGSGSGSGSDNTFLRLNDRQLFLEYNHDDPQSHGLGLNIIRKDTPFIILDNKGNVVDQGTKTPRSADIMSFIVKKGINVQCVSRANKLKCQIDGMEGLFEVLMAKFIAATESDASIDASDIVVLLGISSTIGEDISMMWSTCSGPCEEEKRSSSSSSNPEFIIGMTSAAASLGHDADSRDSREMFTKSQMFGRGKSRKNRNKNRNKNRKSKSKTRKFKH